MESWFQNNSLISHSAYVNGPSAESIWQECVTKYREGSLPSSVVGTPRPRNTSLPFDVSSIPCSPATETPYNKDDDIDALLTSAGTFVRDQNACVSSLIGSHSSGCASSQLKQGNADVSTHGDESSVNVTSDVHTLASTTNAVDHKMAAADESSPLPPSSSVGRNQFRHHSTGQIHQ